MRKIEWVKSQIVCFIFFALISYFTQAGVIYVNVAAKGANNGTSWTDAYTNLQSALSAADPNDEVWVAMGTYSPTTMVGGTGDCYKAFQLKNGIALYGGFSGIENARALRDWQKNPTLLSGDLSGDDNTYIACDEPTRQDNCYHVVIGADNATLDGFIITGGNANNADWALPESQGGGLYNDGANLFITNCWFTMNSAEIGAGIFNRDSTPMLFNCLFYQNAGFLGGGIYNYNSNPSVMNCTFSQNTAYHGGGIDNYSSSPMVVNCILWGNTAPAGSQVYTLFSSPVVIYSDIEGGYPGTGNMNVDPIFADSAAKDFHLSQINPAYPEQSQAVTSPCVNAGSDLASEIGLERYTTATPVSRYDYGVVDMGYHYPFELTYDVCRYADLRDGQTRFLDGVVDSKDLFILAQWWLSACNDTNLWCNQADMNFDSSVNFQDFMLLGRCWLMEDTDAPTSAQWEQEPTPTPYDFYEGYCIEMSAVETSDNSGHVLYKFENLTASAHTSKWRQNFDPAWVNADIEYVYSETNPDIVPWKWEDTQLVNQHIYIYRISIRDPHGNQTLSTQRIVIAGNDPNPPTPNPAQWATQPYQSGTDSISMTAITATDAEGNGVEYYFECVENSDLSSGWINSATYTLSGLSAGQTYTFRVRYRDTSINANNTAYSTSATVIISEPDNEPPVPNPTALTVSWFYQSGQYYHILAATPVTDASGVVEYQFACDDAPALVPNADTWFDETTIITDAYLFNSNYYPDYTTPKVPNIIWVPIGGSTNHIYRVRTRDGYGNTGEWSSPVSSD